MPYSPYIAVVADSFRAALSSRVLWVAMVMLWLFLILLAPFGYREDFTASFRSHDFHNGTRMKAMLAKGLVSENGNKTPAGRLADAMPNELKRRLERVGKGDEERIRYSVLVDALNGLLEDESWYDETVWESSLRLRELRDLDDQPTQSLSDTLRKRRARLRIEAAFPGVFNTRSDRSILLTYGGWDFPTTWGFVVDKTRFEMLINQVVLPLLINWLLGFAFISLGILVTSSIVPEMLQPGSLHLLLSKPISRTGLLVSKFIGGCAFVLLCVCQLILGLYLIAGVRLDIWNPRLFWCIPVSVLMFAVYYSISVAAGLLWRSAILSISVTVVFGAICFLVGFIGDLFDSAVKQPMQINGIALVGEDLFASNRGGGLVRFDTQSNRWDEVFSGGLINPDRTLAPIAIEGEYLITSRIRNGRFNPFGSGSSEFVVLSRDRGWRPEPSLPLPTATTRLFKIEGKHIVAMNTGDLSMTSNQAVLAAAGEDVEAPAPSDDVFPKEDSGKQVAPSWLSKLNNMIGTGTDGFDELLPHEVILTTPRSVLVSPDRSSIFIVSGGRVLRLMPGEEGNRTPYSLAAQYVLEGDRSKRSQIAVSGDFVLVARNEEPLKLLDAHSLQLISEIPLPTSDFVTQLVGLKSTEDSRSRFLVSMSDGEVRVLSIPNSKTVLAPTWRKRLIRENVDWVHYEAASGKVYLVHHHDEIEVLDDQTFQGVDSISAKRSGWRMVDDWLILPLQTIIPETGALGETTASLISGKSAIEVMHGNGQPEVYRYEFMKPIASCGLFILVIMAMNCIYFSTRDY